MQGRMSRRGFVEAVTAVAATAAAPAARVRAASNETIVGDGPHTYRVNHDFAKLPDRFSWQVTHDVAVDSAGNLYVIHEGNKELKDHPSIFVFDPQGKFIRAFGSEFQGGGHGIEVRKEGSEEFLYVCGYQQVKSFAKMTPTGEIVWYRKAPVESGAYAEGEDVSTEANWSRQGFLPTNFAFLDDGGFLLADGYGSYRIHRFDKDAKWVSSFGGAGEGKGTFNLPHGIWIDRRPSASGSAREPKIVICDRANGTLQVFSMEGGYERTISGFGLPANLDTWQNLMVLPDLKSSVMLLDENYQVVARLGEAAKRLDEVKNLRGQPGLWRDGQFVHPHDACFTPEGHIFVAEWVATGRITRLEKV